MAAPLRAIPASVTTFIAVATDTTFASSHVGPVNTSNVRLAPPTPGRPNGTPSDCCSALPQTSMPLVWLFQTSQ